MILSFSGWLMPSAPLSPWDAILAANAEDMAAAKGRISDVMLDRLALTPQRIEAMAKGIRDVARPCLTRWAGC